MGRTHIPMTASARDSLIAIAILWVLFATIVFFRLLGRYRGVGVGLDDILVVCAVLLSSCTIGMNAAVFVSGVGHNFDPTLPVYPKLIQNTEYIMKVIFAFTLIYLWTLAALKLSQLCFYWRAFAVSLKKWIYLVTGIVIAWALAFTFVFIFLCDPVEQQWTLQRIGHCLDQILILKCIIMTNVVTDFFIFLLPIPTVWRLQMQKTEKFVVIACFAMGLGCCIIGIVRFWQIHVIDLIGNLTGTSLTTFMLCTVELMLGGICISIPMLRPFYLEWREKYKNSRMSNTDGEGSYNKGSGSAQLGAGSHKPSHYTAWIEMNDKDQETGSNDDGSERHLTRGQPSCAIHVSRNWAVTKEPRPG